MVITIHGVRSPFVKGITKHGGVKLAFFGQSVGEVSKKEQDWLDANAERLNACSVGRPALRLIRGGKDGAA